MAERSCGPEDDLIPGGTFAICPVRGRVVGRGQCLGVTGGAMRNPRLTPVSPTLYSTQFLRAKRNNTHYYSY